MYKSRLCLGTNSQFGISTKKQIELFKQTGFDGFFTDWNSEIMEYRRLADKIDMIPSDGADITFDPSKVGEFEELLTWKN